jgi:Tol biopolymer transport system component
MVLYSVNDDGSHPVRLFPDLHDHVQAPAWAPDGTRLAFESFPASGPPLINIAEIEG